MLHNTRGIVLKTIKYGETSLIARIYTEQLGLQSYLIGSVRSTQAKHKAALLQPLSLLDMVVYHKKGKSIQHLKELRPAHLFRQLPFEVIRSTLALFVAEVLYKTLKEEEANEPQFEFLYQFVQYLDLSRHSLANVHVAFLVEMSAYVGFRPHNNFDRAQQRTVFDLMEGSFSTHTPTQHPYYAELPLSEQLSQLLDTPIANAHQLRLTADTRRQLLQLLLVYYRLHIENFGETHAWQVLTSVFG